MSGIVRRVRKHIYHNYRKLVTSFVRRSGLALHATNLILDELVGPIGFDDLAALDGVERRVFEMDGEAYEKWAKENFPEWPRTCGYIRHKKLIENYATFKLLDPGPNDVFMDAAGSGTTYLHHLPCRELYMQDIKITSKVRNQLGDRVTYIECDGGAIPLPDGSIDKMSCHHSFEHFQGDSDVLFIKEAQRLLRLNGRMCIVHIFLADHYIEITDAMTFSKKFDVKSKRIIDPTSGLPGGRYCDHYARVYDLQAFRERIVDNVDLRKFKLTITELRMDGEVVPDAGLGCHRELPRLEPPYRVLIIDRFE